MRRWDLLNCYISHYGFKSLLEIGHDKGEAFRQFRVEEKQSVDPNPRTHATWIMTSDDFFGKCQRKYDIIFVDGLHEHNQVYRNMGRKMPPSAKRREGIL